MGGSSVKTNATDIGEFFSRSFNPFTLRVALRGIVCYFHTFKNNLGIKKNVTKYL